eukprot:tig00020556_g11047.t1
MCKVLTATTSTTSCIAARFGAPAEFLPRSIASGVLFRNRTSSSATLELAVVGGKIADGSGRDTFAQEIWIINTETREWRLSTTSIPPAVYVRHPQCAWDGDDSIYCYAYGRAPGNEAETFPLFWRNSISTERNESIRALPAANSLRTSHCTTFYAGNFWMATGEGPASLVVNTPYGFFNDLLRFSVESQTWAVEIENGNSDMAPRYKAACGRLGSRWYFVGGFLPGALVEVTVNVPAVTATWSTPSAGQIVQRGSSLRAVASSLRRAFGPASVVLTAADKTTPPSEHVFFSSVTLAKTGADFTVAIPLGVNGGSYRIRLQPASGSSLQTPAFTIPSWSLLELSSWAAGYETWANASLALPWSAAAWSFPLEAHLLPSRQSEILSWNGVVLHSTYLDISQSNAGTMTFELPSNTTAGDYVIRIVDVSVPTIRSHRLTNYFVVKPSGANDPPTLVCSTAATSPTSISVICSFAKMRGFASLTPNCTAPPGGLFAGQHFARSIAVTDADSARTAIGIRVPLTYTGSYALNCSVRALASLGQSLAHESAGLALVPPAAPVAPLQTYIFEIRPIANTYSGRIAVSVRFAKGQSVAAVEVVCSGLGGPFASNATATDADMPEYGFNVHLQAAAYFNESYAATCRSRVRASTGLASDWVSIPTVTMDPAPPWTPEAQVVSVNATSVTLQVKFMANQSVVRVLAQCSSMQHYASYPGWVGGEYHTYAAVTDGMASGVNLTVGVPPSYSGSLQMICLARVFSFLDQISQLPNLFFSPIPVTTLPAAAPGAPLEVAVISINATQAVVRVRFATDQSVELVELECLGAGVPSAHAFNVSATDPQVPAGSVTFSMGVAATSEGSNSELSCAARVRSSANLTSPWTSMAPATIPPVAPLAPLDAAIVSKNATHLVVQVQLNVGQSVAAVEVKCTSGNAANDATATATGVASFSVNVSVLFVPGYGGGYELSCSARVRAPTGLTSEWTAAGATHVPAAAPRAPLDVTVIPSTATRVVVRVQYSSGQSVAAAEVECSGYGGPYAANATASSAASSSVELSIPVVPSYGSGYASPIPVTFIAGADSSPIPVPFFEPCGSTETNALRVAVNIRHALELRADTKPDGRRNGLGFARLLATALRSDFDERRVKIADIQCGSIMFRVQVLEAASASSAASASAALPDALILETVANLTRAGQLLMPGLDDRPVSVLFNASFAAGVQPMGAAGEALARGESISSSGQQQQQPSAGQPASTPGSAGVSGGGGSPVAAAAGAAAGAGVVVVAVAVCFAVYWKRRRLYANDQSGDVANAPLFFSTDPPDWILQTVSVLSSASDGSSPSVWIELPPLNEQEELDLLGRQQPAGAFGGTNAALGADAKDMTLVQRAGLFPPKPVSEELLKAVREPLRCLGEGAFGRVYAISLPESAATWLRGEAGFGGRGAASASVYVSFVAGSSADASDAPPRMIKRAVKEVSLSNLQIAAREIHGARLQKSCNHPNVLRCEALFTDRLKLYIVLPLAEMSLSAMIASCGVLPSHLVTSFALQIASGMAYLHHELPRPVAHRDLKPQNILVFRGRDGSEPQLLVGDFGISRHVETAMSLRGTLIYLPPETYTKNDPAKADIWAFGIVLMEMATGGKPYGGAAIGPEHLVKGQPFPRSAFGAVPERLRPLARSCLAFDMKKRPNFLEIRRTLEGLLQQPAAHASSAISPLQAAAAAGVHGSSGSSASPPAPWPEPGAASLGLSLGLPVAGPLDSRHLDAAAGADAVFTPDPSMPAGYQ